MIGNESAEAVEPPAIVRGKESAGASETTEGPEDARGVLREAGAVGSFKMVGMEGGMSGGVVREFDGWLGIILGRFLDSKSGRF